MSEIPENPLSEMSAITPFTPLTPLVERTHITTLKRLLKATKMTPHPPLTLYSARICPWAQRVTLAVEEVGATKSKDYKHVEIDLQNKPDWYSTRINPASKVPVIQLGNDDDLTNVKIPESHVLLELVADLYKDSPDSILPDTPTARAEARYFIERFNQVVWSNFFPIIFQGKEDGVPALVSGLKEVVGLLGRHDGQYFLGERLSIADIGVAPFVGRLFTLADLLPSEIGNALKSAELVPLAEYHKTLTSRPSWAKTFDDDYILSSMKKSLNK